MLHSDSTTSETPTNSLCKNQIVNWAVGRVRFKRAGTLFQYQSDHASVWSVFDWKPGGEGDGEEDMLRIAVLTSNEFNYKADKTSVENGIRTILSTSLVNTRFPKSVPEPKDPDIFIAHFQEMNCSGDTTDKIIGDYLLNAGYELVGDCKANGLVGEASRIDSPTMAVGVFAWYNKSTIGTAQKCITTECVKTPLANNTSTSSRRSRRSSFRTLSRTFKQKTSKYNTKQFTMLEMNITLLKSNRTVTLRSASAHLPMKENILFKDRSRKQIDKEHIMLQDKRKNALLQCIHLLNSNKKRIRGSRRSSSKGSSSSSSRKKGGHDLIREVMASDMLHTESSDNTISQYADLVYEWHMMEGDDKWFCPTCEYNVEQSQSELDDDLGDLNSIGFIEHLYQKLTQLTVENVELFKTHMMNQTHLYKTNKKNSYNIPSYCDRILLRSINAQDTLCILAGDLNFRILPDNFINILNERSSGQ